VARLQRVVEDQRAIIARDVKADPSKVPQAFVPYKEVLPLYEGGLKLPDDVTLVWPDDNFGYIRRLSSAKEQERSGGAGVYYHLNDQCRPEHTPHASFSWDNYDEAQRRLDRFNKLVERTDAIYARVPPELKDACYELLVYPVRGAALMNEKQLCAARSRELL